MAEQRETFDSEELAKVLSHYDLGIVQAVTDFPRGNRLSAKVVVTTDKGKFLLKRAPRGKDDPSRIAFTHALQAFLTDVNFPLPYLIKSRRDDNSVVQIGDKVYEMFEFVQGTFYDAGLVQTYEAGRMLGLYHRLLHDYHPPWLPSNKHYHKSTSVLKSFRRVAEVLIEEYKSRSLRAEVVSVVKRLHAAYVSAAEVVEKSGFSGWESQIVHADWHPGNLLFHEGRVVAVIDYDAARVQPRALDLANGVMQFSFVAGGRDLTTWDERTDVLRAKRFLRAYDEINVISQAELHAVPHLMQEALIAQALPPIIQTRRFASLDGLGFLKVVLAKVRWLRENAGVLQLDTE